MLGRGRYGSKYNDSILVFLAVFVVAHMVSVANAAYFFHLKQQPRLLDEVEGLVERDPEALYRYSLLSLADLLFTGLIQRGLVVERVCDTVLKLVEGVEGSLFGEDTLDQEFATFEPFFETLRRECGGQGHGQVVIDTILLFEKGTVALIQRTRVNYGAKRFALLPTSQKEVLLLPFLYNRVFLSTGKQPFFELCTLPLFRNSGLLEFVARKFYFHSTFYGSGESFALTLEALQQKVCESMVETMLTCGRIYRDVLQEAEEKIPLYNPCSREDQGSDSLQQWNRLMDPACATVFDKLQQVQILASRALGYASTEHLLNRALLGEAYAALILDASEDVDKEVDSTFKFYVSEIEQHGRSAEVSHKRPLVNMRALYQQDPSLGVSLEEFGSGLTRALDQFEHWKEYYHFPDHIRGGGALFDVEAFMFDARKYADMEKRFKAADFPPKPDSAEMTAERAITLIVMECAARIKEFKLENDADLEAIKGCLASLNGIILPELASFFSNLLNSDSQLNLWKQVSTSRLQEQSEGATLLPSWIKPQYAQLLRQAALGIFRDLSLTGQSSISVAQLKQRLAAYLPLVSSFINVQYLASAFSLYSHKVSQICSAFGLKDSIFGNLFIFDANITTPSDFLFNKDKLSTTLTPQIVFIAREMNVLCSWLLSMMKACNYQAELQVQLQNLITSLLSLVGSSLDPSVVITLEPPIPIQSSKAILLFFGRAQGHAKNCVTDLPFVKFVVKCAENLGKYFKKSYAVAELLRIDRESQFAKRRQLERQTHAFKAMKHMLNLPSYYFVSHRCTIHHHSADTAEDAGLKNVGEHECSTFVQNFTSLMHFLQDS